jgi:chaperonin GroEL (HSP60 family)
MSESGVKVVVTGGSVDDIALHFLEKYGIMAVKITSKHDLRRLCKTVKARAMVAMVCQATPSLVHMLCLLTRTRLRRELCLRSTSASAAASTRAKSAPAACTTDLSICIHSNWS